MTDSLAWLALPTLAGLLTVAVVILWRARHRTADWDPMSRPFLDG